MGWKNVKVNSKGGRKVLPASKEAKLGNLAKVQSLLQGSDQSACLTRVKAGALIREDAIKGNYTINSVATEYGKRMGVSRTLPYMSVLYWGLAEVLRKAGQRKALASMTTTRAQTLVRCISVGKDCQAAIKSESHARFLAKHIGTHASVLGKKWAKEMRTVSKTVSPLVRALSRKGKGRGERIFFDSARMGRIIRAAIGAERFASLQKVRLASKAKATADIKTEYLASVPTIQTETVSATI